MRVVLLLLMGFAIAVAHSCGAQEDFQHEGLIEQTGITCIPGPGLEIARDAVTRVRVCAEELRITPNQHTAFGLCLVEGLFNCLGVDGAAECSARPNTIYVAFDGGDGYDFAAHVRLGVVNHAMRQGEIVLPWLWTTEQELRCIPHYWSIVRCVTGRYDWAPGPTECNGAQF